MSYKGISAADIERQTNISKGLLSNYFAGRTNMSTSNIEQILDILNINLPFHKKNIPEERYEENDFNHFLIDIQEREVLKLLLSNAIMLLFLDLVTDEKVYSSRINCFTGALFCFGL